MAFLLSKLQWSTEPASASLYLTNFETGDVTRHPIVIGEEFHIKLVDQGYCVGAETADGWKSCMQISGKSTPHPVLKGTQCMKCGGTDDFACRRTCTGNYCFPSSPLVKQMCSGPRTAVYVTSVAGVTKVGVSRNYLRRWIEQGSDYAVKIADLPGLEARKLEHLVAKELGLKLVVHSKRKLDHFNPDPPSGFQEELREVLPVAKSIYDSIIQETGVKGFFYPEPEFFSLSRYYGGEEKIERLQEFDYSMGSEIGGVIARLKGSLLVLKEGMYHYAINLKKMAGTVFEFIDKAKNRGQTSLEEWF